MILDFSPKNVMKMERTSGKSLTEIMAKGFSMESLITLYEFGLGGVTEDEAIEAYTKCVKEEGKDLITQYLEALKVLQDGGFLPKTLQLKELQDKMNNLPTESRDEYLEFWRNWQEGEQTAIKIGLDLKTFWDITPKQFEKHVKAYVENKKEQARELDAQNFNLGRYVAIGVNDPKKYPSKPFLTDLTEEVKEKPTKVMTGEEMLAMAKKLNSKWNKPKNIK